MIKHVLFDVDGTLTEPSEGILNAVLYALPRMGIETPANLDAMKALIGPPFQFALQQFFSLTPEQARHMTDIYREYYSVHGLFEAYVYDGIPALLKGLQDHGILLHTATSKPIEYVERLLPHFDLRSYFTFLAADDLAGTRHSKPEVIRYLLEHVPDITPENTVMVGDRKYDVLAAREFGIRTVGCAWGHAPAGELEEVGAAFIARTPAEAERIILSL